MSDEELEKDVEILAMHVCCYTEEEVQDLLRRVRHQAVLQTADHFSAAHARLGGETYPEDIRDYATDTYGGQK